MENSNIVPLTPAICLKDKYGLVLYFDTGEDRDKFMDIMEESDPDLMMKPLDTEVVTVVHEYE